MAAEAAEAPPADDLVAETPPAGHLAAEVAELTRRAVERDLPIFLLVLYHHEAEKLDFLAAVRQELRNRNLHSRTFDPRHRPEHGAGKLYAELAEARGRTLSLVTELPRDPEGHDVEIDFLRYLNLHRDRIGRQRLRWVLLLHHADAEQFIRIAGDLWAVRQHTFWLEKREGLRGPELWTALEGRAPSLPSSDREAIVDHIAEVRELVSETEEGEDRAALLLDLSGWLRRRQATAEAATVALEGLAEAPEEARRLKADLEKEVAAALSATGHFSEALTHLETSLELYHEVGDASAEGNILNRIAVIYDFLGRKPEALELSRQALTVQQESGDRLGETVTRNIMGGVYKDQARYSEALEHYRIALELLRKAGFRQGEARILNNIGCVYDNLDRKAEALEHYREALEIYREVGDRAGEVTALNNIGVVYGGEPGRESEALEMFQQSLALHRELRDRWSEAMTLNNMGWIYNHQGRKSEALEHFRRALVILREVGDRWHEAQLAFYVGRVLDDLGRTAEATDHLERSVALAEELDHPELETWGTELAGFRERLARGSTDVSFSG